MAQKQWEADKQNPTSAFIEILSPSDDQDDISDDQQEPSSSGVQQEVNMDESQGNITDDMQVTSSEVSHTSLAHELLANMTG